MNRPVIVSLLIAVALLLSGCSTGFDLDDVRSRSDEMSARIMEAYYNTDAYGEESRLAEIWSEYSDLTDPDLAPYVDRMRNAESDVRRRKALDYLFYDLAGTAIYDELVAIEDEILNKETSGHIIVGGDTLAYRDAGIALYNETDSALREDYYLAIGRFSVEELNPPRARAVREGHERLCELGYSGLGEFEAARRGISHDRLEETVVAFLDATRDIYFELTNDAAHDVLGVDVTEVPDYDRGRIFRGAEFDEYFPADGMIPLLEETLSGMGIDLSALPMIDIDVEDRPEKEPRPATYPIVPGEDVRVLVKPSGGVDDYESLFHEMGHALHDGLVRVDEYEFQRLGDYGVTETYAYLPEGLLSDPLFLEDYDLIPDPDVRRRYLKNQLMSDLGAARYYAGLFRYERLLHAQELNDEELREEYARIMGESRLVPVEHPEFAYLDSNEDFYGVNYLEAWFLAAQLRHALTERFGAHWWNSEDAGAFMRDLWGFGAELSVEEIAQRMGFEGLDSTYYINEIERAHALYR
ncbi:hypothetical protein KAW64_14985, partial [bacterium]|nr:hypothetical protein [bacterium]